MRGPASSLLVVAAAVVASFTQVSSVQVDIQWRERLVLPGQNATFLCRVGVPLQYCRVEIPGLKTYNLKQSSRDEFVMYYGDGLKSGQCGVTIYRVDEKNNGDVKCTLGLEDDSTEYVGTMQLVVAKPPKAPELDLSKGTDSVNMYKVGDTLEAQCIVRDGRPVANISWFLDEDPINPSMLKMPTVVDYSKENVQSKLQNLTLVLHPMHNGKFLRCVAFHPAYPGGHAETKRLLDVRYPPVPSDEPLDKFGYQIGRVGVINVTFRANPRPRIEWSVAGEKIREGSTDSTGRMEAEELRELGRGLYIANLRIAAIRKEDTETDYILTAYNDLGPEDYRVKISTSPEPAGLDLGVGAIIGLVASVLIILLLVFILVFAKVTGRWCFSGAADVRNLGESSDTESAEVRPKELKRNLPPIKLTSFFKKGKDKAASESEPDTKEMDTDEADVENKEDEDRAVEETDTPKDDGKGLVYAELDLVRADLKPVVKNDNEKTEYAEIVYTQNENIENEEKKSPKK